MASSWCTIESDPGVFSDLLDAMGVRGVQVEEIYDLNSASSLAPVHGLIFLFKWRPELSPSSAADSNPVPAADVAPHNVLFLRQVIPNACATVALLHVVLNAANVVLGDCLTDLKSFMGEMSPEDRGWALGGHDALRVAHNAFARPEPFEVEETSSRRGGEDAFHFVAYVPVEGRVFELDGLKSAPRLVGEVEAGSDWLRVASPAVEARLESYSRSEIRFALLAVVGDQVQLARGRAQDAFTAATAAYAALAATGALDGSVQDPSSFAGVEGLRPAEAVAMPVAAGQDASALRDALEVSSMQLLDALSVMGEETAKRARWRVENDRRRHNFIPFLLELLAGLARSDKLMPMLEEGKKRVVDARERVRAERLAAAKEGTSGAVNESVAMEGSNAMEEV